MSRINTNVQSLIAQRVLAQNHDSLRTTLERLSTGFKINRGRDGPAALIASENLRSELRAINAAVANAERADQVVNIAEGGLQEISSLLTELQGLVTQSASRAGLSPAEKDANQLQIDSILQTIDRIASATSFQGMKLLNGNFDYKVSSVADGVAGFRINGAKFTGTNMDVHVRVTQSAQQGGLYLSFGASTLALGSPTSSFVIEVAGTGGSRELTFSDGTSLSQIAQAINEFKTVTGVQAAVSGTGIVVSSTRYGSSEFVAVRVVDDGAISTTNLGFYNLESDDFNTANTTRVAAFDTTQTIRDFGQNVGGTVNGMVATASGRTMRVSSDFLDMEITLDETTATTLGAVGTGRTMTITGGGADFQLAARVDITGKVSLGIGDVAVRKLGDADIGFLSSLASGRANNIVNGDLTAAQRVVDKAVEQISALRGRLGAFQKNTIGATIRSLGIAAENTAAAESVIRDADFASETAQLTRAQILVAASTNVLALANTAPQSVLQLLR